MWNAYYPHKIKNLINILLFRKYKGCESSQIPELSGMVGVLKGILDDPILVAEMEKKKVEINTSFNVVKSNILAILTTLIEIILFYKVVRIFICTLRFL